MKAIKNLRHIGFVRKAGGFMGGVILAIENGVMEDYEDEKFFFIELQGKPVPFAVEEITMKHHDSIVKFEDVNDVEAAKKLTGKKVFVEKAGVGEEEEEEEEMVWTNLVGYRAIDSDAGELGKVRAVEEYPQQWIAKCIVKGKEILIPLNEDTVMEIDQEQQTVHFDLPKGLIDLYLT